MHQMTEQEYIKHIEVSIAEIRSIDMKNSWAYEQVIHAILKIQKLPIILYKIPVDSTIFRARINTTADLFTKVSEISAPKKMNVQKFGRANKPSQVLFYGSQTRPVAYLEFATHLSRTVPIGEEAMITMGVWKLSKEIQLVLVFNPSLQRDNYFNRLHGAAFDDFLSQTPVELRKGTKIFFEFIGEEYAKWVENADESYLITCAYTNIVFAYKESDGIMYPSVPLGGEGFNVALKENIHENGYLKLESAIVDKFIAKKQENGKHEFLNNARKDAQRITETDIIWEVDWNIFKE